MLQQIRNRALELRKTRDPLAATLTTLLSDIEAVAKDSRPPRQATDEDALKVVRKYLVTLEANIELAPQNIKFQQEKQLLGGFLPTQLSEQELVNIIQDFAAQNSLDLGQSRNIGTIIKYLNANYNGQFDSKSVNGLIRQLVQA